MRVQRRVSRAILGAIVIVATAGAGRAEAAPVACSVFRSSFLKATGDLKSDFVRPLTVTRGGREKDDVYDLVSNLRAADAVLTCQGEKLSRFEANLSVPADPGLTAGFDRIQRAALTAAFKWSDAHAQTVMKTINSEAAEYLRASIQRGDVVQSGKTEYHEGGGDLGMMWTSARRTFVVVGED